MSENEEVTIEEVELIVVAQQRELNRLMHIILWILVVLFVITIVTVFRGIQLSDTVDKLDDKTEELETQVTSAKENLETANAQIEDLLASSPEAVREALFAIFRIEQYLCGGPCANEN